MAKSLRRIAEKLAKINEITLTWLLAVKKEKIVNYDITKKVRDDSIDVIRNYYDGDEEQVHNHIVDQSHKSLKMAEVCKEWFKKKVLVKL